MKNQARRALLLLLCVSLLAAFAQAASFQDVAQGMWYTATVEEMTAQGYLKGYADGTFRPNAAITAAEFVTVTARIAGLQSTAPRCGHWASGLACAALEAGWYDWDELPPDGGQYDRPIARQVAVKILMKALLPEVRGSYSEAAPRIRDLASLDGRYYDAVFAAYAAGVVGGDSRGNFNAKSGLTRAEACAILQRAAAQRTDIPAEQGPQDTPQTQVTPVSGGVSENGWLRVIGTQLCNEAGEPVVLRGMSSHGLQWFGQYCSCGAIRTTADYGANVFRVAMYTGEGGYLSDPAGMKQKLTAAVDAAIACDMYVIIDWHILSDGDPMANVAQAEACFKEMAKQYGGEPAVLFEICNEPNGGVGWSDRVKPYAQRIVRAIRTHAPDSIILIGSPTWSQDVHLAAADPVAGTNLMYTCHFYAGTHGQWLRDRIDAALRAGLPIFISEWGTSAADGSGGVYLDATKVWLDFLAQRGLSWCNWSLCDKQETSAALAPGASAAGGWKEKDLSASGKFVFSQFKA